MKKIFEYIPHWLVLSISASIGGFIGLGLFALLMMLGDYLNSL